MLGLEVGFTVGSVGEGVGGGVVVKGEIVGSSEG